MSVGTVISTQEGPSVSEFSFVINEEDPVRRGQFITLDTQEGTLIARVSDVFKSNRYFQRAESVREYERSGKKMSELFPVNRWEYLIGEAKPLAVFQSKLLQRPSLPPSPGSPVHLANEDMLSTFVGLDIDKGLHLGSMGNHDVDAKMNLTKLLQKHLAILSISGGGKSYLTSVLLEELLDRPQEHGQVATVVIDTHGEYIGFAEDENYRNKTTIIQGDEFKIGVPSLSPSRLFELIPDDVSGAQQRHLRRIIKNMRDSGTAYDLTDLMEAVAKDENISQPSTVEAITSHLRQLHHTRLFGRADYPSLGELAKPGHMTIIDVSSLLSLRQRRIVTTYLGRKLFNQRVRGNVPPFFFVIEEAHNFAPEGGKNREVLSKSIIEKIAREGRKFHASLCLISQRPVRLSTTALSQCNTHIILRVTNPNDLDHIGRSSEGITRDVLDMISTLRVGEALIVGEAVNYPIFVKVRERRSKQNERGTPLEEAAVEYVRDAEQAKEDAASLLE